jgi:nondiscriminating glutamyl-tRNA synthetase
MKQAQTEAMKKID